MSSLSTLSKWSKLLHHPSHMDDLKPIHCCHVVGNYFSFHRPTSLDVWNVWRVLDILWMCEGFSITRIFLSPASLLHSYIQLITINSLWVHAHDSFFSLCRRKHHHILLQVRLSWETIQRNSSRPEFHRLQLFPQVFQGWGNGALMCGGTVDTIKYILISTNVSVEHADYTIVGKLQALANVQGLFPPIQTLFLIGYILYDLYVVCCCL